MISKIFIVCRENGKVDDNAKCFMLKQDAQRYCGTLPDSAYYIIKRMELVSQ
jgi:hypothetical protein